MKKPGLGAQIVGDAMVWMFVCGAIVGIAVGAAVALLVYLGVEVVR